MTRPVYTDHGMPKPVVRDVEGMDLYNMDIMSFRQIQFPELEGNERAHLFLFDTSGRPVRELQSGPAFDYIRLNISRPDHGPYIAGIVT